MDCKKIPKIFTGGDVVGFEDRLNFIIGNPITLDLCATVSKLDDGRSGAREPLRGAKAPRYRRWLAMAGIQLLSDCFGKFGNMSFFTLNSRQ